MPALTAESVELLEDIFNVDLGFDRSGYARVVMSLTRMQDGCLQAVGSKEGAKDIFTLLQEQ